MRSRSTMSKRWTTTKKMQPLLLLRTEPKQPPPGAGGGGGVRERGVRADDAASSIWPTRRPLPADGATTLA